MLIPEVTVFIIFQLSTFYTPQLILLVIPQLSWPIKFWSACIALEFSIFSMSSKMIFEVPFGNELLSAYYTFIVPHPFVAFHVNVKISFFSKFITTNFTLKWLNSEVLSYVNFQPRFLWITRVAYMALEWFINIVIYHMCLQMSFGNKRKSTLRELANEGSFICLIR
jgi:hypothetical protein